MGQRLPKWPGICVQARLPKAWQNQDTPHLSQDEQSIEQQKEQTYYENVDEVDSYWRGLWETEANENLYADWFKEVEDGMGQTGGGGHTKSWQGRQGHKSNWHCLLLTEPIQFKRGICQGHTLFPLLLYNVVEIDNNVQEYKLSKPVDISISDAFFIHHLKLYSSSEGMQGIKVALTHLTMDGMDISMAAKKTNDLRRRFATVRGRDDWRPRRQ